MYRESRGERENRRRENFVPRDFRSKRHFMEIRNEVLDFFGVEKGREWLFWAQLDTLIEKSCLFTGEIRPKWLEEGLREFFPEREWQGVPQEIMDYAREEKMHFLIYKDNGVEKIQSEAFLFRLLVDTAYKLVFVHKPIREYKELQDNVLQFIEAKVPADLLNREEVVLRVQKFNRLYLPNLSADENALAAVFSPGVPVWEKIFEEAAEEYSKRRGLAAAEGQQKARVRDIKETGESKQEAVFMTVEEDTAGKIGHDAAGVKGPEEEIGKEEAEKDISRETDILLEKYETTISLLQEEIEEYKNECLDLKREIESLYAYAGQRYETAVKDIIFILNKPEYGHVLSQLFLFAYTGKEFSLEDIRLLLRNFFVALEKVGIKSSDTDRIGAKEVFKAEGIGIDFVVDRDVKEARQITGEIVMPGWKYKGKNIILPVVRVEE
ncbi:hypothetical protein SAMN02745221_01528 [Thermosyntropha lipolytica DSM 11003]|uniref:Uncharacterized protein n=1 Tax=Thermosyntropha lipolytica DSM 11003 TaxID=1123382 RepID=A0A1M5PPI2_9FIRM|nr:hypothetical protein [Thermosyntropha lipolytica]SHH03697.1 hypothetical protein SAMN02745221_01528 [Thermosyntropha lipolytica DSM 11003]